MRAVTLTILLFLSALSLFAQNSYSVRGSVADTTVRSKLENALIIILNANDSTIVQFERTGAGGTFSVNDLNPGKFILLCTYPSYADYIEKFELDSVNRTHDFNQIRLILKSKLLEEVLINGTAAITIRGDTTIFSTKNLVIQPNSKVEDLLKQLPGIQVDRDGKITAQGQVVKKVLVDGEEFFGDDPTLVTRNIRGDMVKNIQLYDKKNDQASFTGIDDGVKEKTLNVQLKEDSKNGYFGKADVGAAPNNYYQTQAMYNRFKAKEKFASYGTIGNTGKTGLGSDDADTYEGSDDTYDEDFESYDGKYDGRGIPLARSAGAHYNNTWSKDKESFNANYQIGSMSVDGSQNTFTQNNLPISFINTNADQDYHKYLFRQKLDTRYETDLSSNSKLKIEAGGILKNTESNTANSTSSEREDNTNLNSSNRNLSYNGDQKLINANVFWAQNFKKAGRKFSLNVKETYNANATNGVLNSSTSFYDATGKTIDSLQLIDQYKVNTGKKSQLEGNMTWSEPFSKTFSLILNYGLKFHDETSRKLSFNKSSFGTYDVLDEQFSNNFKIGQVSNLAGAIFNYTRKKNKLDFGTWFSAVNYDLNDLNNNIQYKQNYINWSPLAKYTYKISQQRVFMLTYQRITTQPVIDQLQPIRVNDDPLNITLGNTALKPSFENDFELFYSSSKTLTNEMLYVISNFSLTSNPISNKKLIDESGKSFSQAVNITTKTPYNYSFVIGKVKKLSKSDWQLRIYLSMYGNSSYNYVNNELNTMRYTYFFNSFGIARNKQNKYDFVFRISPRYRIDKSSLLPEFNDKGWNIRYNTEFTFYLPGKMEISSDATYSYTEKTPAFNQSISPFIWNSTISKKFLKKENLKFSITGSDLLNQNVGFSRGAYTQNSYTTIKRYFMGSLTWDFSKMGAGKAKE